MDVEEDELRAFASRHGVHRLALFGSALRDDFGLASDIDLLVEFEPGRVPGLLTVASMELELSELIAADRRTPGDLSRYFRDGCSSRLGRSMPPEDDVRRRHLRDAAMTAVRFANGHIRSDHNRRLEFCGG